MPRTIAYLKRIGVEFNNETWAKDDKGNIINVYLKDSIGGFAIHVRRKAQ
jgi:2-dehydro-3-deoxyphosphogluconate aldolase/(4S)-4-hydroxy-2-oxoglutarate aldolase